MQSFLCLEESRNEPCVATSVLLMQGKGAPSPAPHPRKCRFAHTGKACLAVQILCWNFRDRTNYKAITQVCAFIFAMLRDDECDPGCSHRHAARLAFWDEGIGAFRRR